MTLGREKREYTPRDPNTIDLNCFDPIRLPEQGFPGDIPKDLLEVVGTGHEIQAAESLRTLFWVSGVDEAVDVIDDPTLKLNDCLEVAPFGTDVAGVLINRYVKQNLLPSSQEEKRLGYHFSSPPPSRILRAYTPRMPDIYSSALVKALPLHTLDALELLL